MASFVIAETSAITAHLKNDRQKSANQHHPSKESAQ
jgi:hypothetical protein